MYGLKYANELTKIPTTADIQKGNLIVSIFTGFVMMRAYKTIANLLLSRNAKVLKILGNIFLGVALIGGSVGALFSSAA